MFFWKQTCSKLVEENDFKGAKKKVMSMSKIESTEIFYRIDFSLFCKIILMLCLIFEINNVIDIIYVSLVNE